MRERPAPADRPSRKCPDERALIMSWSFTLIPVDLTM